MGEGDQTAKAGREWMSRVDRCTWRFQWGQLIDRESGVEGGSRETADRDSAVAGGSSGDR